jgi:hypothetical protein
MNTPNTTRSEQFDEIIQQELTRLPKEDSGRIKATAQQLQALHPETRLVVYLNAKSGRVWVADLQAFRELDQDFYRCLNSYIGGLRKADFQKYACAAVTEAAEYHRAHFVPKKSAKHQSEQPTAQE